MTDVLVLKKKIITDVSTVYLFEQAGKQITVEESEAKNLIMQYPPQKRNCKIVKGEISMKANAGNMVVEQSQATKPPTKGAETNQGKGVQLYTTQEAMKRCDILSNAAWFASQAFSKEFLEKHQDLLWSIDHAKIVDYKLGTVVTPYGTTGLNNLSTGLKTVLNICYLKEYGNKKTYLVNIDDCGENAITHVLKIVNNSNIQVYLTHVPLTMGKGYKYFVNGQPLADIYDFCDYLEP